jgi:hypothetical protein
LSHFYPRNQESNSGTTRLIQSNAKLAQDMKKFQEDVKKQKESEDQQLEVNVHF